jgi:cell division protein ZapA (FtsZ GTPase activity inhibitor)
MTIPGEKTRITVDIYGNSYRLMSGNSPSYMKRVADLVNDQMVRIADGFPRLDSQRIAVLSAVNIADENLRMKEMIEQLHKEQLLTAEIQAAYDKLKESDEELKREYEANLKLMMEQIEKVEQINEDMSKLTEQNELLQEQISGLYLQVEKEKELGNLAQEQSDRLKEQFQAEKEHMIQRSAQEKKSFAEQLQAEKEAIREQFQAEQENMKERFLAEKEALLERHHSEKEEMLEHHRSDKEEMLEHHRSEKEEIMQGGYQDEALKQELSKVQSQYRSLQEEYSKLQNEYDEWIELVETESPDR